MVTKLNIFLDETGKDKNDLSLIGAVSIPSDFYQSKKVQKLNRELQKDVFKLHFTQYDKSDYDTYIRVIKDILSCNGIIRINGIIFKKSQFRIHPLLASKVDDMIYGKIPERVIYGLLRNYSNLEPVNANIFIESSEEYKARNLNKVVKDQINTHALYRFDNFKIKRSNLVAKNQQIGVEVTDIFIGILRLIINCDALIGDCNKVSNTLLSKILLINDLLPTLENLFTRTSIYELSYQDHLTKIPLNSYLGLFKAKLLLLQDNHPDYFTNASFKKLSNNLKVSE